MSNHSPTVSVIIPAFNSASFIGRCISSVLNQSYEPKEIIVVDDGSEDNLEEVLSEFDGSIRLITQENKGASTARNVGVKIAVGDYVAFLDSDDFWRSDKLERQLGFLSENTDVVLCSCSRHSILPDAAAQFTFPPEPMPNETRIIDKFVDVFSDPYLGTPGVVVKRSVFEEEGGFDSQFVRAEDVDLWMRIAWGRKIARMTHKMFVQVRRPESLSDVKSHADNLRAIEKFCDTHIDFSTENQSTISRVKSRVYLWWAQDLFSIGDFKSVRKKLTYAIRLNPFSASSYYLYLRSLVS